MFKRKHKVPKHKHVWSKWTSAELVMIRTRDGLKIPYIGQTRTCDGCGLREYG